MADLSYDENVVDNGNRDYSPERTPSKQSRRSRSRSRSPIRRSRSRSPRRRRSLNLISKRVMVSNIPYEMKWQHIKDIFRKEVGDVAYVDMFETPDGKSRGSCVVEMKTMDLARKAIEIMHRFKVKDRFLIVREERESDLRRPDMYGQGGGAGGGLGNMPQGGSGNVGLGMGGGGGGSGGGLGINTGGRMLGNQNIGMGGPIDNRILQQLGIEGPLTNTVFVANLDFRVTWRKLKDVFKLAGNAVKADIKVDKDGKSRGMGTVQFETPLEAVQAISMFNGQTLYDRQMMVRLDKVDEPKPPIPRLPSGLKSIGMGLGIGGAPLQNLSQLSGMDGGLRGGVGGNGGLGGGGGGMSGLGGMGGMGSMDMGGGMSSIGSGMSGGMSGNIGGMSGNMGGNVGGLSSSMGGMSGGLGGMGSGSSGLGGLGGGGMGQMTQGMGMGNNLGGMGGGLGMSDNFSSGMGMSSNIGSGMGGGMKDSMGMSGMGGSMMNSNMMNSSMGAWGSSNLGSSGMSSNSGDSGHYGSYNSNDRRSGSGGSTRPDNCTVIVKNLPYSFTWQTLKDRFQDVGTVKFAEIEKENGRSSGVGYVRFGNPADAERAVTLMNRTRMENREILVRPYRN